MGKQIAHDVINHARTNDIRTTQNITFDNMLLSAETLSGLNGAGFHKPSPIQLHGIPLGKCGFDLLLEAKSGTGKTLVFSTIALEKIYLDEDLQVIILTPTREIAAQVHDVITTIGSSHCGLVVQVVMGGLPFHEDVLKFKKPNHVHILVGSPGRIRHLIQDKHVDMTNVRLLVLDEADKLLEKSFQADVNYIFSTLPEQKQIIMSSATYPKSVKPFIDNYMKNAQHVCPNTTNILLGISQKIILAKYNSNIIKQTQYRYQELLKILTYKQFKQCLIFCNFQARVNELYKLLRRGKWPAEKLYGQQDQCNRLSTLKTLQEFKCRILVSTDLAARGIDASNVDLVVNFEPPYEWTTYLHRIGRAGRYGSYGTAVTVLSEGKEEINFRSMLGHFKDEINISEFVTGESMRFDTISVNSSNSNKSDSSDCEENIAILTETRNLSSKSDEVWHINIASVGEIDEIKTFHDLNVSFEKSKKVDTFLDLLECYKNADVKSYSESCYKVINVKNYLPPPVMKKKSDVLQLDILSDTYKGAYLKSNVDKEIFNLTTLINDEQSSECKFQLCDNTNKRDKFSENKLFKNMSANGDSERETSKSDKFDVHDCNNSEILALYGLPTSFGGKKYKERKSNSNTKKIKQSKAKEKVIIAPSLDSETSSTTSIISTDDIHGIECNKYGQQKHSRRLQYCSSNESLTSCQRNISNQNYQSDYLLWYKELKFRMKHIEYAFYIEEMSK